MCSKGKTDHSLHTMRKKKKQFKMVEFYVNILESRWFKDYLLNCSTTENLVLAKIIILRIDLFLSK